MAEKDIKLASVVRALKEKTTPKKVENRLSRMLSSAGLETGLHDIVACEGGKKVHHDTLIVIVPSDVQKPYAKRMEYFADGAVRIRQKPKKRTMPHSSISLS